MNAVAAIMPTWIVIDSYRNASDSYKARHPREIVIMGTEPGESEMMTVATLPAYTPDEIVQRQFQKAQLMAAGPDLRDALADLVGLIEMVSIRADVPADLPSTLRSNHRYQTAVAFLKRLEGVR
jgi:hypothetical protein